MTDDPSAADDAAAPPSPADGSDAAPAPPAAGNAIERLRALAAERASAAAREAVARRKVLPEPPAPPIEPVAPTEDVAVDVIASSDGAERSPADLSDAAEPTFDAPADEPSDETADAVAEEHEDAEPGPTDEPVDDEPVAHEQPVDGDPLADETAAADPPDPVAAPPTLLPPLPVSTPPAAVEVAGGLGDADALLPDGPRGRGRLVVLALGGLLAVAAITFGVLFVLARGKVADRQKVVDRREAARAAAVQTFSDLTTVDYNDQAGYTSRLSADTTGGLHDQIGSSAGSLFQTIFVPAKEVLKGTPVRAAVSFTGGGTTTARALVLGHVLLTATSLPAGKEEVAGYAFHLKLVDGRWLVDTAASLGGGDTSSSPGPSPSPSPSASSATEPSASAPRQASASPKASASPGGLPSPAPPASSAGGNR